jgi:hypothetical protein
MLAKGFPTLQVTSPEIARAEAVPPDSQAEDCEEQSAA